ncbi:MAG: hypothetical protein EOL88_14550 [Bacteroidia bacterium]|nr:hypothetical protein [Bacteroidia bacterium]
MLRYFVGCVLLIVGANASAELVITSPKEVCNILKGSGLSTMEWRDNYGYECSSRYKEIGSGNYFANNLAYYVDGIKSAANQAKLVLNVNNKSQASTAITELLDSAELLSIKLAGEELPQTIKNAITSGTPTSATVGNTSVEVTRDDWPTGKGYEIHVIFK